MVRRKKVVNRKRYFLGGATWAGEDNFKEFINKGIWRSGWGSESDKYREKLEQIRVGDRIAIKKGLGPADSDIVIKAIGIVRTIDLNEEFCTLYVDWICTNMKRKVESKGCYKTIHGPYSNSTKSEHADWINKIFSI